MKFLKYLIYIIGSLVILFFAIGVINPSVKYNHEVIVNSPLETSWEVFTDESKMDQWVPNFKSIELVSGRKNAVGSKYKLVVEDGGELYELTETITAFSDKSMITIVLENEQLTNEVESIFLEVNGRTRIQTKVNITGKDLLMKSSLFLMKGQFVEQSENSYHKLKSLIESY
jgi:uncharacterized membrane protein